MDIIQKYVNDWATSSYDLFGGEDSTNASNYFGSGLKGRYRESDGLYKDPQALRLFITETGKMIPRRISGNCARHQRPLSTAIKRARHLALLPTSAQGL